MKTKNKTQKYVFHVDSGHGWLEVPVAELQRLGMMADVSRYSHRLGEAAFLEEDCDAEVFCRRKKAAYEDVKYVEHVVEGESKIRDYPMFYI